MDRILCGECDHRISYAEGGQEGGIGGGIWIAAGLIGYFVMSPNSANLWPLSLILGTVIALPPAFVGAYMGRFLRGSNNLPE